MRRTPLVLALAASAVVITACSGMGGGSGAMPFGMASGSTGGMSFFVTSTNPGRGANFGGLAGADAHCQALATQAGAGNRTWRAYLSTSSSEGAGATVHARERIGRGPWFNARGEMIAANLDELHGNNRLSKQTALTERGQMVSGRGDAVNLHDILTGTMPDGRAAVGVTNDTTCRNWTSGADGGAIVGHHDRVGLRDDAPSRSWNSSHVTRGCNLEALRGTGGGGLLYCFAAN
jgi:hypothetical protein